VRQVLVTGAAGFLGLNLIAELRRRDLRVVAVDDGSAGTWHRLEAFADDPDVLCRRVDICDAQALARVWPEDGLWAVAHLAARHFIPDCQAHPEATWKTNVEGTATVLGIAARRPPERFLLASTADVYEPADRPHSESDTVRSGSVYGRTKQAAETMVAQAASRGGPTTYLTARLFNLYGPRPTVEHLIPAVVRQALAGPRIALGNLDSIRDYVYVTDAAAALAQLLEDTATGVVNIGTGVGTDGHRIVELTSALLGQRLEVVHDPSRMRPSDRSSLIARPQRLHTLLPWWPVTSIREGLSATLSTWPGVSTRPDSPVIGAGR
jgi:UDP-glucose 4-epimerase